MTEFLEPREHDPEHDDASASPLDAPLDAPSMSVVREVTDVSADAIPREMMWARIQKARAAQSLLAQSLSAQSLSAQSVNTSSRLEVVGETRALTSQPPRQPRAWVTRAVGIAALLVAGVGVGRYLLPASGPSKYQLAMTNAAHTADSVAALGLGPEAIAAIEPTNDPAHVAMEEHLVQTVALLMTVRDETPSSKATSTMTNQARELLSTTRLLLDEPQLRDERTRRLLQDLELVLVQIIQARGSAPETQRAPNETMRETNLLPRVRAAVTATRRGEDPIFGGGL